MRNIKTFLYLGLWIMILPFLGFPHTWKNVLYILSGLTLVILSYVRYREARKLNRVEFDSFSENVEFSEEDAVN